jgi:hypothetical protein
MRAYRDQGQWYFIPPQRAMEDKWEKTHYTEADFARDRRDEIDIRNSPSSPVEITDQHAYMIRKFPSLRNIKFTLRNKTSKKVVAIRVRIGIEGLEGFTEMDGPTRSSRTDLSLSNRTIQLTEIFAKEFGSVKSSSERSNLLMAQNGSSRNLRLAKREANAERVVVDKSR